jgi:hypothetical protein
MTIILAFFPVTLWDDGKTGLKFMIMYVPAERTRQSRANGFPLFVMNIPYSIKHKMDVKSHPDKKVRAVE